MESHNSHCRDCSLDHQEHSLTKGWLSSHKGRRGGWGWFLRTDGLSGPGSTAGSKLGWRQRGRHEKEPAVLWRNDGQSDSTASEAERAHSGSIGPRAQVSFLWGHQLSPALLSMRLLLWLPLPVKSVLNKSKGSHQGLFTVGVSSPAVVNSQDSLSSLLGAHSRLCGFSSALLILGVHFCSWSKCGLVSLLSLPASTNKEDCKDLSSVEFYFVAGTW